MSLARQGMYFILVGLLQVLVDWAVFVGLTSLGVPAVPANLGGRVCGACLGFWLNGRITFAAAGKARLGGARLVRFLMVWLVLTALSTAAMAWIADGQGLGWAWLAKPLVEAALALTSFLFARHWIYR
ncbi:GtrA family protein [Marilutibacter aestuarii]|uniref:GtrA family protein n=1 Tax=Marilutibacter aestuarii TaxID=1706195 RepID=A0A508A1N8_9GAMM|nr:GtrA family protein [Lysobacter aestuarii]TQD43950.1 GtrA family protein [Lysobacter aestuarii]